MNKHLFRWIFAGVLLVGAVMITFDAKITNYVPRIGFLIAIAAAISSVLFAKSFLSRANARSKSSRPATSILNIKQYLIPIGIAGIFISFLWPVCIFRFVSDSTVGALIIFIPSIIIMISGISALFFRVYIWFNSL